MPQLELEQLVDRADDVLATLLVLTCPERDVTHQGEGTEVEVAGTFGSDRMAAVRVC